MPDSNQLLDYPRPQTYRKIRKFYFWFFELGALGTSLGIITCVLPLIGELFYESEHSFLEASITLMIASVVFLTLFTAPVAFVYQSHKLSVKYDRTANKKMAEKAFLALFDGELMALSIITSFLILILNTIFLLYEYSTLDLYTYYLYLFSILFSSISISYCFIIGRTVHSFFVQSSYSMNTATPKK